MAIETRDSDAWTTWTMRAVSIVVEETSPDNLGDRFREISSENDTGDRRSMQQVNAICVGFRRGENGRKWTQDKITNTIYCDQRTRLYNDCLCLQYSEKRGNWRRADFRTRGERNRSRSREQQVSLRNESRVLGDESSMKCGERRRERLRKKDTRGRSF